jgi:ribose 5-phosphate isomerase B
MDDKDTTRDRVRALVREVLANAAEEQANAPKTRFIDVAPPPVTGKAKEFDRDESDKYLITENDLRGLPENARLRVSENARFTPLAADLIRERKIELIKKQKRNLSDAKIKIIAVGCDHGGFETKEKLKDFLGKQNFSVRDFGTNSAEAVDYPDFAAAVARAVADKQADVGIIIDGAGIGSAMTANKIRGVRAAACYNVALAKNSREHNDANVLTLGSGQNTFAEICEIVTAFLSGKLTEERHRRRVAKIEILERQYLGSEK